MIDLIRTRAQTAIRQTVQAELESFLGQHVTARKTRGAQRDAQRLASRTPGADWRWPSHCAATQDAGSSRSGRGFRSLILPPYLKKTRLFESVRPWLYLEGVSSNNFDEALAALFGESVRGLGPATISRLKSVLQKDYKPFCERGWRPRIGLPLE